MKKLLAFIPLLALLVTGIASCDKIVDKIFNSFVGDGGSVSFTIDPVTSTDVESDNQNISVDLDIDRIIRENTNGAFGLNSIGKVTLQSAELIINNPDAENNIQNLESFYLAFNTNTSTDLLTLGSVDIPDQYGDRILLNTLQGVDLKPYLTGTQLSYIYRLKARKVTTKPLECTLKFKLKFD